jgi:hypothetical protein
LSQKLKGDYVYILDECFLIHQHFISDLKSFPKKDGFLIKGFVDDKICIHNIIVSNEIFDEYCYCLDHSDSFFISTVYKYLYLWDKIIFCRGARRVRGGP